MDGALQPNASGDYEQIQERVFARLQPDGAIEERLAKRIALCRHTLDQIRQRLTETWGQLNKVQEAFRQDPLP